MSTVVLDHTFDLGLQDPANFVTLVSSINIYEPPPPGQGVLTLLGFTISSDVTAVVAGVLKRTITLATNAQGNQMYGGDATKIKDATRNLFRSTLALRSPASVVAAEPVVT